MKNKEVLITLFVLSSFLLSSCAGPVAGRSNFPDHSVSNRLAKDWLYSSRNPESYSQPIPQDNDQGYSLPYGYEAQQREFQPYGYGYAVQNPRTHRQYRYQPKNPYNSVSNNRGRSPYQSKNDAYQNYIQPRDNDADYYIVPKSDYQANKQGNMLEMLDGG